MPLTDVTSFRTFEHGVNPIFPERWSPRAMNGEPVGEDELRTLFEAARWAPSSYNNQSWRFIYALRDTPSWDTLFNLLGEFNQTWCADAGALVVVVSKTTFDHNGNPSRTHSFDTGAAWMSFALQGAMNGLVVHGMQGFSYDRARSELGVHEGYEVEAMAAVGRLADLSTLSEDIRKREQPTSRKPQSETVFEGRFRPENP